MLSRLRRDSTGAADLCRDTRRVVGRTGAIVRTCFSHMFLFLGFLTEERSADLRDQGGLPVQLRTQRPAGALPAQG